MIIISDENLFLGFFYIGIIFNNSTVFIEETSFKNIKNLTDPKLLKGSVYKKNIHSKY